MLNQQVVEAEVEAGVVPQDFSLLVCGDGKFTVNARLLHQELSVQTKFADWVERNFGDFVEGEDYLTRFSNLGSKLHGGQNRVDYLLTQFMAKHLCQLAKTDRGRAIRTYLIRRDEELTQLTQKPVLSDKEILSRAVLIANRELEDVKVKNLELESKIERTKERINNEIAPKLSAFNQLKQENSTDGVIDFGTFVNTYRLNKYIGRNTLFNLLRDWNWIRTGRSSNRRPTQYAQENGWLVEFMSRYEDVERGLNINNYTSKITAKGCAHIMERLVKEGYIPTTNVELL